MASLFHHAAWAALPICAVALGLLSPFESLHWAPLALFIPLALVLRQARPVSGLLAGWLFGTLAWGTGTYWIVNGMRSLMDMSGWVLGPTAVAMWLYLGLPFAVLGLICGSMHRWGRSAGPLFCAVLLTLLVYLRPPLCPVSSAVSVALWPGFIQIADLGGEPLVFFCLVLINWLLADALARMAQGNGRPATVRITARATTRAVTAFILLAAILGYGAWRLHQWGHTGTRRHAKAVSIATVQPNVPSIWGKADAPLADFATDETLCLRALTEHLDTVRNADVIVFPEQPRFDCLGEEFTSSGLEATLRRLRIPALLPSDEFIYAQPGEQSQQPDAPLQTPEPSSGAEDRAVVSRRILAQYNSVFFLPPGAVRPVSAYRKMRLVPFSEATPLRNVLPHVLSRPRTAAKKSSEISAGRELRLIHAGGVTIQPLVCFESGFADLVRQGAAQGADVLVEVSNDAWFASRDAEIKHLGMGIFRAVEMRRPLVRCSNSGVGAHVRASGEILPGTLTAHGRPGATSATVHCPETTTPYARWGDTWLWGLALIVLAGLAISPTRSARHGKRSW